MSNYLAVFLSFLLLISCKNERLTSPNSEDVEVVKVHRFDQLFYQKSSDEIQQLKQIYPYLFPSQVDDSVWVNKSNNKDEIELKQEAAKLFGDFKSEEKQLGNLFINLKKYFPQFKSPKVISLISGIDYESKVIYADSLLLISMDMYLGKDHKIYQEFPSYLSNRFDKSYLMVDVAQAIADKSFDQHRRANFIQQMINQGKKMSLVNALLPEVESHFKMGYTKEQLEWVEQNELAIWQYFVQNKLLYSYEMDLLHRFVYEAPFSKFYLEHDAESPGRIGIWLGWQIVESYLKNNEVSVTEMISKSPEEIFEKSRYKPKK